MNVALYARVSSEKQAENDLSIAAQLKALRDYTRKNNWIVYKEFIDEAESARSANRPAFQEMIAYAKKRDKPFEAILVWKHSRFARNREDAIIYKSLLRKHGVTVISINEQIDDSPSGKLLEGIIEVIDEFYSANLAHDTIRGLKENAGRGFQNGSAPIGYKSKKVIDGNVSRTKLEPDEVFAPVIKRIFHMSLEHSGIKEIAKTLNNEGLKTQRGKPWSKTTVMYVLKNETYTGTLVYNKRSKYNTSSHRDDIIRVENNHPALIDRTIFQATQKLIAARGPKILHPRHIQSNYLLSGFIYCGICGLKMIGCSAKSGKFFYYACQNHTKRGKEVCTARFVNKQAIEHLVVDRIKTHVLTEEHIKDLFTIIAEELNLKAENHKDEILHLNNQINSLREKRGNLYAALESRKLSIDDLAPRIKEITGQMEILERKKYELQESFNAPKNIPFTLMQINEYVKDFEALLRKGSFLEQKAFLRSFIKRIEITHPKVTIHYTIPLPIKKTEPSDVEVLSFKQTGCPVRTRTSKLRTKI